MLDSQGVGARLQFAKVVGVIAIGDRVVKTHGAFSGRFHGQQTVVALDHRRIVRIGIRTGVFQHCINIIIDGGFSRKHAGQRRMR